MQNNKMKDFLRTKNTKVNEFLAFRNPMKVPKKELSWTEAKVRYPKLNPMGDADKDGTKNWVDCRPFDKKKQDEVMHIQDTMIKRNPVPNRRIDFYKNYKGLDPYGNEADTGVFRETRWQEFQN